MMGGDSAIASVGCLLETQNTQGEGCICQGPGVEVGSLVELEVKGTPPQNPLEMVKDACWAH